MRIEPPVFLSSSATVTEDCKIGPYTVKKDTNFMIDLGTLHKNPEQW